MTRYRFQLLLSALFVLMLTIPLLPLLGHGSQHAATFFFSLMLLSAVAAVSQKRSVGLIALGVYVLTLVTDVIAFIYSSELLLFVDQILALIFLCGVITIILKNLFYTGKVSFDTICAALSVYLLLAVLWSVLYGLLETTTPGSFVFNTAIGSDATIAFDHKQSVVPLYYSLVTITTLGYGDISPISPMACMLSTLEAVIGQFYLTVLVAWLVGMHISTSVQRKANN